MMSPRVSALLRGMRVGVGVALLTGLLLGALDGGWALCRATGNFEAPAEAAWFGLLVASAALVPAVVLGMIEGAAGVMLGVLSRALADSSSPTRTAPWFGRLGAFLATPAVVYVCAQIFRGPRAQQIPGHDLIALVLGVLSLFLLSLGIVRVLRLLAWVDDGGPRRPRRAAGMGLLFWGLAIGLFVADQRVLPRLYEWFHLSLFVLVGVSAQLGTLFLCLSRNWLRRRWLNDEFLMLSVTLALVIVGGLLLSRLTRALTFRGLALEHSSLASRVLRLHALAMPERDGLSGTAVAGAAGSGGESAAQGVAMPERAQRLPESDVFLITVDALRYDRLRPATMPVASALAAGGVRFERAYTQVPHTSFAVATLLTGKPVYALLTMGQDAADHETLPMILRRARFKTAAFFPPSVFFIEHERLKRLEESAYGFEYVKYEYLSGPGRTDQVVYFLSTERPERTFVWVHYLEPHEPYDVHPGGPGPRATDRERYDGEVRFVDQEIGRLLGYLRVHRPRALVILAADHGEEFGEHGGRYHGTTLYEEQVHVPLFLADLAQPSRLSPRQVAEPVGLIDVAPTILGLLDIAPSARMRGRDLLPYLPEGARPPPGPIFGEIGRKIMVVMGSDKLICDRSTDTCALYDLSRDPEERKNRIEAEPERARALREQLSRYLLEASQFEQGPGGPIGDGEGPQQVLLRGRAGDRDAAPGLARLVVAMDLPLLVRREAMALLAELCVEARALGAPAGGGAPVPVEDGGGACGGVEARAALAAGMAAGSGDTEMRRWAMVVRLSQGDAAVLPEVGSVIRDEAAEGKLRMFGALALLPHVGAAGGEVVPLLLVALPVGMVLDDPDRVRPLILGLGGSRDPRALEPLLQQLDNVRSRVDVVVALGLLGQGRAVLKLSEMLLGDPYVPVRAAAATALGKLGGKEAAAALSRARRTEREALVLAAVGQALGWAHARP